MYDGMINVRKEQGFTSHDVVAKLRGILHQKKIGHTGTLDPDAVGVLPVCLGKGTRLCDMITDKEKTYVAVMLLGRTTDTQDIWGRTLSEQPAAVTEQAVREAAAAFVGDYMQIPPMYSAVKIGGKKLYELARAGKEVERKPRPVVIHSLKIMDISLPRVTMEICCSKGTYIRTLCHDMGERLGCGACMEALTRTAVGRFRLENAHTLDEIQAMVSQGEDVFRRQLVSIEEMLADYGAVMAVDALADKMLLNGNRLQAEQIRPVSRDAFPAGGRPTGGEESASDGDSVSGGYPADGQQMRVYTSTGLFTAVYQYDSGTRSLKNIKMFV